MTLARAKVIYHRDFWLAAGCNYVPESARFDLFDMAVNSGSSLPSWRCSEPSVPMPMVRSDPRP